VSRLRQAVRFFSVIGALLAFALEAALVRLI